MPVWFLIVTIAISLSLAPVVLTNIRTATAMSYYAVSSFFIVFWVLGTLAMLFAPTAELVYMGLIVFLLASMAVALYMMLFSKRLAEINFQSCYKAIIISTIFMVGIAFFTVLNLPASNVIVAINQGSQNTINFQYPWFFIYALYFIVTFSLSYIYLIIGLFKLQGKARRQLAYVASGIFATSFLLLGANILLPLLGDANWIWLGPTSTIFYVVMTSLMIAKHRLFDARVALALAFTYVLSLATLVAIYFVVTLAVSSVLLNNQEFSTGKCVFDISFVLVLAIIFQPIRNFFDRLTNKIFFRDRHNIDDFVARLGKRLSTTTDLRVLLEHAAREIADTLKAHHGVLVVHHNGHLISEGSRNHAHLPSEDVMQLDMYVDEHGDEPVVVDLIERNNTIRRLLLSHHAAIVVPLLQGDVKVGYLLLGGHRTGNYTQRDIKSLMVIRDELVIAIQNALSIQEVRELNATLQQRIDEATKELRTSNAQLQRLDKAKDEFVSMASHQLRTPLTSVKGCISMVLDGDAGKVPKSQRNLLDEAFTSSERMVHLINDFLNVSRLRTGKFLIEKRPVDLPKVVEQELDGLSANAKSRNLSFVYKQPKGFPILDLDEDKMRQVIMNFADNSIYYSAEYSRINVSLSVEGKNAVFTVKDTGIGVPRAEQSQLFSKFYRASNARKQRPDGTGVGLFLAKKVIDAHDGKVIFESVEGKGSTFGFRLPLDELRSASNSDNLDNQNDND
jgi:signal transduction histidine kinase